LDGEQDAVDDRHIRKEFAMSSIRIPLSSLLLVAAIVACSATGTTQSEKPASSPFSVPQAYENLTREQGLSRSEAESRRRSKSSAGPGSTVPGYLKSYLQLFEGVESAGESVISSHG
jgi:hypothetical protein